MEAPTRRTAALLRQIPGLYTAFFSILAPKQYITPHWGYYKGFLRYHLGVIVPNNNEGRECFLRVNSDPEFNARRTHDGVEDGETYYWKNGEGIVFDDNYLHDAATSRSERSSGTQSSRPRPSGIGPNGGWSTDSGTPLPAAPASNQQEHRRRRMRGEARCRLPVIRRV